MLVNFLPVGSQQATEFYMECALEAGVARGQLHPGLHRQPIPNGPRASPNSGLPIVGDDIKAQLGATIVHRTLSELFGARGVTVEHTYQLNTGGNTDFLNMLDRDAPRLQEGVEDRGGAVRRSPSASLTRTSISARPTTCRGRRTTSSASCGSKAELLGGVPMNLELRLSVEDSPNSAAVRGRRHPLLQARARARRRRAAEAPSAFYCKHPPEQMDDKAASEMLKEFIESRSIAAA